MRGTTVAKGTTNMSFAETVKATANAIPNENRFANKVWIHHVYTMGFASAMTFDAFKASLWQAHQNGLVTLSRCDLVEAFAPGLIRRSTLDVNGATFNLVRL